MKRILILTGLFILAPLLYTTAQDTNLCDPDNVLGGTCLSDDNWHYGWWWQRVAEGEMTVCSVPPEFNYRVDEMQNLPPEQRERVYATSCEPLDQASTDSPAPDGRRLASPPPIPPVPDVIPNAIVVLQDSPIGDIPGAIYTGTDFFDWNFDAERLGVQMDPVQNGIVVFGNDNINYIVGSPGDDILYGFGDIDEIYGEAGYEPTTNNTGNDYIDGGTGNDFLVGEGLDSTENYGNDIIFGGEGWDAIAGDSWSGSYNYGNDYLDGGPGLDFIMGDSYEGDYNYGDDKLFGGPDTDSLYGEGYSGNYNYGNDYIDGGLGLDELAGDGYLGVVNRGNDRLYGSESNDAILGETFDGTLDGGNDIIVGGDGSDFFRPQSGVNTVDEDSESNWQANRTNACDPGGSRAGQCTTPFDWELGWWLQRIEDGDIRPNEIPDRFR